MIDKNNYVKWIIGIVIALVIIAVIIFIRNAKKQADALAVKSNTGGSSGSSTGSNNTTGSTSVYVFSALTINPLNKLDLYNSYPNDIAYSISVPSYPLGVVVDLQGASNFMKIINSNGQVLLVRKTGVYTI